MAFAVSPIGVRLWCGAELLPRANLPLVLASLVAVGLALTSWFALGRPVAAKANALAFSALLLGPLVAEAGLRASFEVEGSPTRAPIRFAHNLVHDDYWVLAGRWNTSLDQIAPERIHPRLGWCQNYPTEANPIGLYETTLGQLQRDGRPKVLFYGDSYVAGHSRPENHIPAYMGARLPASDVVDLGVGGYGTGQSYLLYEETSGLVEKPLVLMSAMIYDLDRATLNVRTYQKPRLRLEEGGGLRVTNTPIHPNPRQFFQDAPLSFRSFALQAIQRRYLPLEDPLFAEKLELNRAILVATAERASEEDSELLYVLFHTMYDLLEADVRSTFFVETLDELGIECFDTREPLLAYIEETGVSPRKLYVTGHHNDLGNQIIGDALLEELRRRGYR